MLSGNRFGEAGQVVIEEFLQGEEARLLSWLTVKTPLLLPPVKTTKHMTTATGVQHWW